MFSMIKSEVVEALALHRRFWLFAKSSSKQIYLALGLTTLSPLLGALMYSLIQKLTDNIFYSQEKNLLPWLAFGVVLAGFLKMLVNYFDQCLDAHIAERIVQEARVGIYSKLISASPATAQHKRLGDWLSHLDEDTNRISALVYGVPVGLFAHWVTALFFLIFLFSLSWQLTLIALLIMPLLAWSVFTLSPLVRRRARIARKQYSNWMSRAEERLGALSLIYVSDAKAFEVEGFSRITKKSQTAEVRARIVEARLSFAINLITGLGSGLVLLAGIYQVQHHAMTVGAVLAFVAAVGSLYDPLRGMTQGSGRWQRSVASAERLEALLARHQSEAVPLNGLEKNPLIGSIQIDQVAFSYNRQDKVLNNITLSIDAGEHVALVGASGCGKSTLLKLLAGLELASSGKIKLDGMDMNKIARAQLHASVAIAFQEPFLFSGSVAENIRYNLANVEGAEIRKAGAQACVDHFVRTSAAGYGTPVGSRGSRLSGGQRQRIAIARALVRKAPILLMDEATSALDSETEELILQALAADGKSRTLITVSHRLSSVRSADRIIVLDQGEIIEQGTPAKLLRPHTRCYELFSAQIAAEQTDSHATKKLVVGSN
jgi:subfamily B ATP-binding cassette protein MsbA